jgi:hypothetical protein
VSDSKLNATESPKLFSLEFTDDAGGSYADNAVLEVGESAPGEPYRSLLIIPQFLTERMFSG